MKNCIFAANWKLHKTPAQVSEFFVKLNELMKAQGQGTSRFQSPNMQQIFFPPAALWHSVHQELKPMPGSTMSWGAQNCFFEVKGAFTGENSLECLKEMGGQWVLIGHSERRSLFAETNEMLSKKFAKALEVGILPMLCVGETLKEREAGKTQEALAEQLRSVLSNAVMSAGLKWAIAYEPVWAIGTGKVATLEMISEAHLMIQKICSGFNLSEVPVLYGGSVKPENAKEILALDEVHGILVGGASLEPDSWLKLLSALPN